MPMHTAPWYDEAMPADAPPMLRVLRGDFFCAPFGDNDVVPGGGPQHGPSASGEWRLAESGDGFIEAALETTIMGARLTKRVEAHPGETVVYQRHVFTGGEGRLPVGHHAMLRAEGTLKLGFAPRLFAGTPPEPVEVPPTGRSILAYPQEIGDPAHAQRADGGSIDLTTYPVEDGHEDLWMLASDPAPGFAWTAATSAERRLGMVRAKEPAHPSRDAGLAEQRRPELPAVLLAPPRRHRPRGGLQLLPPRPCHGDRRQPARRARHPDRDHALARTSRRHPLRLRPRRDPGRLRRGGAHRRGGWRHPAQRRRTAARPSPRST